MRKIEKKIIKIMRECLDGKRPAGVYALTKRDKVELLKGSVRYVLWGSVIFKATKCTSYTRLEFSDNGYNTRTTHSRLKALAVEFIAPYDSLCVKGGFLCKKYGRNTARFCDLSNRNIFEIGENYFRQMEE